MEPSSSPTAVLASSYDGHPAGGSTETGGLPLDMTGVSGLGVGGSGSESGASGNSTQHPNIFVRGLPLAWSESEITAVFQQYGVLSSIEAHSSIRLVRHSVTKQSLG